MRTGVPILLVTCLACGSPDIPRRPDRGLPILPSAVLVLERVEDPTRRDDLDGDNWPSTWLSDGSTLAAYGDGWGVRPRKTTPKLNTGMVRLAGSSEAFTGTELPIPHFGEGAEDPNFKGCGLLEVDGIVYHFLRYQSPGETGTRRQIASKLIWSSDGGSTWENADWVPDVEAIRFFFREPDHAFHSPTFLQAGRGYADAPDEFVYVYSPEGDQRRGNDGLVLARVPRNRIRERADYRFFAGFTASGEPRWSDAIGDRKPVLRLPGHVSPGDVVYLKDLDRYLLATVAADLRAASRLVLLDAPAPWGPWTLVGTVSRWGTGVEKDFRYDPRIPAAWIRAGGLEFDLVFSDRTSSDKLNHQTVRLAKIEPPGGFEWTPAAPVTGGFDEQRLSALRDELFRNDTLALLIARGDRVVLEAYADDYGSRSKFGTASLAKSVVGGYGFLLALQDGLLGIDDPASRFIPSWADDAVRSTITIRQLANHTSGLAATHGRDRSDPSVEDWKREFWARSRPRWRFWEPRPNPFRVVRDATPISFEPGTRFEYSNAGVAALDLCVATALHLGGKPDLRETLRSRVYEPIGIDEDSWDISYGRVWKLEGVPTHASWGGARFTVRATARLGRLALHRGDWQGRTVLAESWMRMALDDPGTPDPEETPDDILPKSTFLWWSNRNGAFPSLPRDAFLAAGIDHQILLVVPSLELIVVRYGRRAMTEPGDEFGPWRALERRFFRPLMEAMTPPESSPSS